MLIRALQIQLHREVAAPRALAHHRVPRRARLEPHIEDVPALLQRAEVDALGRVRIAREVVAREQRLGRLGEPHVRALCADDLDHGAHARGRHQRLATRRVEGGDGQAPRTLARDAPVRPRLEHASQPIPPPRGVELHVARDRVHRHLAQALLVALGRPIDAHEPLLGAAEDHGRLAPPVVRIRVHERVRVEQMPRLAQAIGDLLVRVEDAHAPDEFGHGVVVRAIGAHGAVHRQVLVAAGHEVLGAMARRGVDQARAVLERHVPGGHDRPHVVRIARAVTKVRQIVAQRRAVLQTHQGRARRRREHLDVLGLAQLGHLLHQLLGEHRDVAIHVHQRVREVGVDRHSDVRGKRPGRGGPDHEGRPAGRAGVLVIEPERSVHRGAVARLEVDVHREVLAVLVLELGLGKRRLVGDRPVHGLERAIHQVLLEHPHEHIEHRRLVLRLEREVRVVVVRECEQPRHLLGVQLVVLAGVVGARPADRHAPRVVGQVRELGELALLLELGEDLVLDGQPVRVPARHVGAVPAHHRLGAHDEVLEALVHQVPHVDRAVGIGRPIVEDEPLALCPRFSGLGVQVGLRPALERRGLVLHEVRLHGEGGLGQVERGLVGVLGLLLGWGGVGHRVGSQAEWARAGALESAMVWTQGVRTMIDPPGALARQGKARHGLRQAPAGERCGAV